MNVQVITREGQPEYAVLPWNEYQALLRAAGLDGQPDQAPVVAEPAPDALAAGGIARLRERLGMSQADLARAVGISPSYLAMIEEGEREPSDPIRRSLARALGVLTEGA